MMAVSFLGTLEHARTKLFHIFYIQSFLSFFHFVSLLIYLDT